MAEFHYQLLETEILLTKDSADVAIKAGEKIRELALPRYFFSPDRLIFYNVPWSKDILARAYLKKGDIHKAIAEYERLLSFDPASKDRRLTNPKYHYSVARLYQQKGSKNKAIQHYKEFLDIWRNADEGIPELMDARNQYQLLTQNKEK
jgi:tetratricopeptide (TPR) repeat protein